jgi:hypothetical protein
MSAVHGRLRLAFVLENARGDDKTYPRPKNTIIAATGSEKHVKSKLVQGNSPSIALQL